MLELRANRRLSTVGPSFADVATSEVTLDASEIWHYLKKSNGTYFGEGSNDELFIKVRSWTAAVGARPAF